MNQAGHRGKITRSESRPFDVHRARPHDPAERKDYYAALERNNKALNITDWLTYFASTVLEAQAAKISRIDFYIAKVRFYDAFRNG